MLQFDLLQVKISFNSKCNNFTSGGNIDIIFVFTVKFPRNELMQEGQVLTEIRPIYMRDWDI